MALGYALAHPHEVRRLVLMAPAAWRTWTPTWPCPASPTCSPCTRPAQRARGDARRDAAAAVRPALLTDEIIERAPIAATQTQAARSVMKVPNMTTRLRAALSGLRLLGVNDQFNPVGGR